MISKGLQQKTHFLADNYILMTVLITIIILNLPAYEKPVHLMKQTDSVQPWMTLYQQVYSVNSGLHPVNNNIEQKSLSFYNLVT